MFRKKYIFFLLFYLALILFVATDAWLYQIPVARIQKVRTEESGVKSGARGEKEQYYEQTMEAKLLNGDQKGDKILLKNEYSASQVINQKYHKWDQVLVSLNGEGKTATIKTLKRDVYLAALFRPDGDFASSDYEKAGRSDDCYACSQSRDLWSRIYVVSAREGYLKDL